MCLSFSTASLVFEKSNSPTHKGMFRAVYQFCYHVSKSYKLFLQRYYTATWIIKLSETKYEYPAMVLFIQATDTHISIPVHYPNSFNMNCSDISYIIYSACSCRISLQIHFFLRTSVPVIGRKLLMSKHTVKSEYRPCQWIKEDITF